MTQPLAAPNWPPIPTGGPHVLLDRHATSGRSQELRAPWPGGLSTIVLECFPAAPNSSGDMQVLDAGAFGPLMPCADPKGTITNAGTYYKEVVRNVMDRVAVDLTVHSGAWSVWVTFIPYGSTIG